MQKSCILTKYRISAQNRIGVCLSQSVNASDIVRINETRGNLCRTGDIEIQRRINKIALIVYHRLAPVTYFQ